MKKFILKVVNGERSEWERISLLLTMGFFTGIFVATYDVGASTLFLDFHKEDEESAVAQAFLASGILGIITTYVFGYYQKRIKYQQLVFFALLLVTTLVSGAAIWLHLDHQHSLVLFVTFVLIGPTNAIVILLFWGLFGRIFNFRGAKRLAGGIDSGQAIATIFAFFTIPLIQNFLPSIADFLIISALSLVGTFVSAFLISTRFHFLGDNQKKTETISEEQQEKKKSHVRKDYVFLMSLFVTCSALAAYFVEYSFLTTTSERYQDVKDLAQFLSFFGGTIIVVAFLIQTFINDIILEQYGLKIALLFLPILLALFTIVATFVGHTFGYTSAEAGDNFLIFFVIVAMSKLFVDALRDSLENPTVKIFFFPLDVSIRFDIQTRVEGFISQFAGFLAGLLLTGLGAFKFFDLLGYYYVLFIVIGVWIYATIRMHNEYTHALTATLSDTVQDGTKSSENEKIIPKLLRKELTNTVGESHKYVLNIAGKIDPLLMERNLLDFPNFKSTDQQLNALKKISERRVFEAYDLIKALIDSQSIHPNIELAKTIFQRLKEDKRNARKNFRLAELATSPNIQDRIEACHLIVENYQEETFRMLIPLIRDPHPDVKRAAMITAGKLRIIDFLPILIPHMSVVGFENTAVSAILNYGEEAMHALETAFYKNGQKQNAMINIVQIYGLLGGERATELLLKKIDFPDRRIVKEVLHSLNYCGWTATGAINAYIRNYMDNAIADTLWNIAALEEIEDTLHNQFLKKAMQEQLEQNYDELFLLLSILYEKEPVQLVRKNIESGTSDSIGYAIELLDIFVEDDLKYKLIPVLDDSSPEEKLKKLDSDFPRDRFDGFEILREIINRDYNSINRWTKVCAIHSYAMHEKAKVIDDLVANLFNPDPLIRETAAWAICKHDPTAYQRYCDRLPLPVVRELNRKIYPALEADNEGLLLDLEKVVFLYQLPLMNGVSGVVLSDIIEEMEEVALAIGDEVNLYDEFNHQLMLIIKDGKIALKNDQGEMIAFKDRNQFISDFMTDAELSNKHKPVAVEDSTVYVILLERFYEIMGDHYELTEKLLHNLYLEIENKPQYS